MQESMDGSEKTYQRGISESGKNFSSRNIDYRRFGILDFNNHETIYWINLYSEKDFEYEKYFGPEIIP